MDNNKIRRGALAIIIKGNKVLMGKKCHRPGHFLSDAWHFPGGKAEEGEKIENTVVREMKEELGLDIRVLKLLCEYTLTFGDSSSQNTVFICEGEGEPIANDDLVDAHYFDYEDIIKLHHKESFDKLPNEVKEYLTTLKVPEIV